MRTFRPLLYTSMILLASAIPVPAQERLCDTAFEDCRAPILNLIRNERVGIDVALWFMEDARYVNELILRHQAGVPIRILVDQRANASKRLNAQTLATLRDAGIPMRDKYLTDILHFKMMLFQGQNVVEFSKANYTDAEFVPITPNNYSDEAVFFTNDDRLTNSFRRRFDDLWIDTTNYENFANITNPLVRQYPMLPIDPSMNFPPLQDFSIRTVPRLDAETQGIDAIVYRVTDQRLSDAVTRAVARGIPVRLIIEPTEYRNPKRLLDAKNVDRMWMGGAQIKMRQHEGLTHEASIVLHALGEAIFGSANWSPMSSAGYSDEHNFFYEPSLGKPWFFQWFADQFMSKWNDAVNFVPFQPLPPEVPSYSAPANGAVGQSSGVTLTWDGGTWAYFYDIYFGTTVNPPLVASNLELGSPSPGQLETFTVNNLVAGTTYYWRIVGKTWAQLGTSGPTWSFVTAGGTSGGGSTPFGGTAAPIPGTLEAENFDDGGPSVAYYDTTAGNKGGAYRATDVDIAATTDVGGGYYVGWAPAGEWLKYTVNVANTDTYTLETRLANMGAGARFHVEVDGVDRTGLIAVPDTGGWQMWQTATTTGISLTAGQHVIRVVFDAVATGGGVGNYNWFRFTASTSSPPPPPPPTNTPFGGTAAPIPGTLEAEKFDDGGLSVAYYDTTAGNKGGAYRATDVDVAATTDVGGGYYVGWTPAGEWLKYTVNVASTGTYTLETRLANMGTGARFHVEVDGVDRTGPIAVPDTGGWQMWQTVTTTGIPLSAGQHVIRVVFDAVATGGGVGNYNWFRFTSSTP